ncbi:MAG: YfhO family protein [Verrucomicrobiota bacterium]|nr:YfhO family protein [Verrucomicrobiota bacterium]
MTTLFSAKSAPRVVSGVRSAFRRWPTLAALAILLLTALAVYWPVIFGGKLLLYKDIGSDSLLSYYPDFIHLSRYLRTNGFPSWSFHVGMGQDLAYALGFLVFEPVSWLPRHLIAPGLSFQHVTKVLLVGLLFFRLLQMRGIRDSAALLGALLLSFSAYTTMGSCWYPLVDEVLCFAALLLGIEYSLQQGRWLLFAAPVALVGVINPFYLYLCALFLVVYVTVTVVARRGPDARAVTRICLLLAAVAVIGAMLGAALTLPYLYVILQSPRGSGSVAAGPPLAGSSLVSPETASHYWTLFLRTLSNDLAGTADAFRGWQNYLEAPLSYAGLVPLLLVPQFLVQQPPRRRSAYLVLLGLLLLPALVPWFRYAFWLFEGDYYRTYSLFVVLAVLLAATRALSSYLGAKPFHLPLLIGMALAIAGLLFLPVSSLHALMNEPLRLEVCGYLVVYALLLAAGQLCGRRSLAVAAVVGLSVVELTHFSRISVLDRKLLTRSELAARVGFNDETVEALQAIKEADPSFFRVTKTRAAEYDNWGSLNDALAMGYYGTRSYSSFNDGWYIRFLEAVGAVAPDSETSTRWSLGLTADSNPLFASFAGEKYVLTNQPSFYRGFPWYRTSGQYGADTLLQSDFWLPLGLTFTRYMREDEFLRLPKDWKAECLLRAAVVPDGPQQAPAGLTPMNTAQLEQQITATPLQYVMTGRRSAGLRLTEFRQSYLQGQLRLDQPNMLVVQTPYDRGWHAYEDGAELPVRRVDVGLLGVLVSAGEHRLELRYRNPLLVPGVIVSAIACLLIAVGLRRYRRLPI